MRVTIWRIVKEKYASTALDGQGARRFGGRFNSPGTAVVYASSALSLAILEMLVHMDRLQHVDGFVSIPITFDSRLAMTMAVDELPSNWYTSAGMMSAQRLGDAWVRSGASAILRIPSVLLPNRAFESEHNFIINPAHIRFAEIEIGESGPLSLDSRLRA